MLRRNTTASRRPVLAAVIKGVLCSFLVAQFALTPLRNKRSIVFVSPIAVALINRIPPDGETAHQNPPMSITKASNRTVVLLRRFMFRNDPCSRKNYRENFACLARPLSGWDAVISPLSYYPSLWL